MCKKAAVIARLTLTNRAGQQTVIEIHADAGFQNFFRWYTRPVGRRDKHLIRVSARNDAQDLEALEGRLRTQFDKLAAHSAVAWKNSQIVTTKLVVLQRKLYKKILAASPDQLLGGGPARVSVSEPLRSSVQPSSRKYVAGYTPLAKRWSIITGKA